MTVRTIAAASSMNRSCWACSILARFRTRRTFDRRTLKLQAAMPLFRRLLLELTLELREAMTHSHLCTSDLGLRFP